MHAELLESPERHSVSAEPPQRILIIDDDESMVDVLSRRLSRQGYQVLVARNGDEGREMAHSRLPQLILLDLRLPDADGFVICQELADSSDTCAIPVIILSGMERPDIIRRSRAAGCQYFVRKPYDPNALLILVRHAMGESQPW